MSAGSFGRLRSAVVIGMCMLAAMSCDESTGPRFGYARVHVLTTGSDPDNLYHVASDTIEISLSPNAAYLMQLPTGVRTFKLEDVAINCIVDGSDTTSADITPNDTVDVSFKVDCAATGITVVTRTTGQDIPSTFELQLSPATAVYTIAANGVWSISQLTPGRYEVKLRVGVSNQCSLAGDSVAETDVVNRQVSTVIFNLECVLVPRSGVIAFNEGSKLMVMNADGSGIAALNTGWQPSWSRDGTRIVFTTTQCDYYGYACTGSLAIVDPLTRQITTLDKTPGGFDPAWSPTDDVIAYIDLRNNNVKLTLFDLATSTTTVVPLPDFTLAYNPSWSPDGTQLALTCYGPGAGSRLCTIKRDGSNFRYVDGSQVNDQDPKWSPDGKQLVFSRASSNGSANVAVLNLEGGAVRTLTSGFDASWSPDGSQIIFSNGGLKVINVDGSGLRILAAGNYYAPSWRR